MSDAHPIERSIKIGSPEIQEIDELREVRREVVVLPDVALQQSRIVRQAVYDLRSGEGEPFDLANATRAAVEEGIVPGGGVALMRTLKTLDSLKSANDDQKVGINIVRKALQAPARQIAENAGEDGAVVAGKILDSKDYAFGYNAQTGEYGDLVKQGVIDPAKVVRTALQDAASVAGLLVTTEAMVAEKPKPKAPPAMPPGGGMGDMDY